MEVRKCPVCGRGDLLQAQIRTVQCLGCGAIIDAATGLSVVTAAKSPPQSATGALVVELNPTSPSEPEPTPAPVVSPWTYPPYGGEAA